MSSDLADEIDAYYREKERYIDLLHLSSSGPKEDRAEDRNSSQDGNEGKEKWVPEQNILNAGFSKGIGGNRILQKDMLKEIEEARSTVDTATIIKMAEAFKAKPEESQPQKKSKGKKK